MASNLTGAASAPALVRFEGVGKSFDGHAAVDGLDLDLLPGEFFALLGPSGCGKTTLLRMLAGFEIPDRGRILLDGADIAATPPHLRPVNMMFQSYALFPHMSVEQNVAFGLKQEGLARREIAARVADMLALLRLDGFGRRKPHQLSGGQRQRVALARALVKRPRIFLLDEPLAALDKKLRSQTQYELRSLQRRLGVTFLIVTHDQQEAMTMADRIGVMNRGSLAQVGAPREIYEQPNSRWVAEFVGDVNLIEGRVSAVSESGIVVDTAAVGPVSVSRPAAAHKGDVAFVAIRPEKIALGPPREGAVASGTVTEAGYSGDVTRYLVRLDGSASIRASAVNSGGARSRPAAIGERVTLSWEPDAPVVLLQ